MILVTTTPSVDGYTITNYQGIVFLARACATCSAAAARAMRKS